MVAIQELQLITCFIDNFHVYGEYEFYIQKKFGMNEDDLYVQEEDEDQEYLTRSNVRTREETSKTRGSLLDCH